MLKTYNVALEEGVDYDTFWDEIETSGFGTTYVPSRGVRVIKERESSLRQCWYELTEEEADTLREDPRVLCVEIPIDFRDDIGSGPCTVQRGLYYKDGASSAPANNLGVNWGLFRTNSLTNNTTGTGSGTLDYNYPVDGTGVDVVIMDGGMQIDHPEFQDANGVSRVQQIDWYTASGVTGTMPAFNTFYTDYNGHGTHVAGIAAGKTYGRAKNSRIYLMTIAASSTAPTTSISYTDAFDCIRGWHNNKAIDPATGYKRPTVVNMSWIIYFLNGFENITGGTYRGTPWVGSSSRLDYGMIGSNGNGTGTYGGYLGASEGTDIAECLAAGIHLVTCAGNWYQKIDVPGGVDYDNLFTSSTLGTRRYHRGTVPNGSNTGIIVVGAVGISPDSPERKLYYSQTGPRVDIYAPGAAVVSAVSSNYTPANTYPANTSYKIASLWGTSMASPQVAGLVAQYLQVYPTYTPAAMRQLVINTGTSSMLDDSGLTNDYANNFSLLGGPNKYAYMTFNSATNCNTAGTFTGTNITINT